MAPTSIGLNNNSNGQSNSNESPLSKTYQYRKIMKPMLERKRRARINRCLDELKDLITGALQNTDGEENITKLEKADILELTCRHFRNLQRQNKFYIKSEQSYADRFREGFSQCAKEVTKFLYTQQNRAGEHIIVHLNECMRRLDSLTTAAATNNNNNMQIANNNNYISNDTLQLDLNHHQQQQQQQSQAFVVSAHHHHNHHLNSQQNIRQPIAIPLVRKSPIPAQNYLQLPLKLEPRIIDNSSPNSRDSMSSERSTSSSPGQLKDDVWRPW
ncbi:hypothetical protein PVAND_007277 [Polypedilum vanderplanki]|uniref:Uncharacterized protein n=1 Tax=Polypedilum vanderplanki TaxID=319348 RepID=A0A9J6C663_POLVA|nr:hypothetical protein PVAND_007277 [Polypedilum vanderplanki]